jgi:Ca2+-binding RTX toxin-like protein
MTTNRRILLATIALATVLPSGIAHAATLDGDGGANTINGTGAADRINGKGGDDRLNGLGGADRVFGAGGDDRIRSTTPDHTSDRLYGGAGDDSFTMEQRDKAFGGPGNDSFDVPSGGRGTFIDCGPGRFDHVTFHSLPEPATRGCETVRHSEVP